MDLNHARLPIPPRWLKVDWDAATFSRRFQKRTTSNILQGERRLSNALLRQNAQESMENSNNPQLNALDDIRALAHDLSNSLEIILQAAYLLAESELEVKDKRWAEMIDTAARDAAQINHKLLEILRSQTEMPARGSR